MKDIFLVTLDSELKKLVKEAIEDVHIRIASECATTKEAIEAYRTNQVPLIIVDLFIPDTSGLDLIKTMKKINETINFLLITRVKSRGLMERAFRHGAADTLIYPCSKEAIRDTILHRLDVQPEQQITT